MTDFPGSRRSTPATWIAGGSARSRRGIRARADRPRRGETRLFHRQARHPLEERPRHRRVQGIHGNGFPEHLHPYRSRNRRGDLSRGHPERPARRMDFGLPEQRRRQGLAFDDLSPAIGIDRRALEPDLPRKRRARSRAGATRSTFSRCRNIENRMATPEEINDRLLVGYVPTYILVIRHRHPDTLKISESVVSGNIVIFWTIVYSGMIYAHFSNGYDGFAVVSPTIAGMFAIRELLEKFRLSKRQSSSNT